MNRELIHIAFMSKRKSDNVYKSSESNTKAGGQNMHSLEHGGVVETVAAGKKLVQLTVVTELGELWAILVKRSAASLKVMPGDALWWSEKHAHHTPYANCTVNNHGKQVGKKYHDFDILLTLVGTEWDPVAAAERIRDQIEE